MTWLAYGLFGLRTWPAGIVAQLLYQGLSFLSKYNLCIHPYLLSYSGVIREHEACLRSVIETFCPTTLTLHGLRPRKGYLQTGNTMNTCILDHVVIKWQMEIIIPSILSRLVCIAVRQWITRQTEQAISIHLAFKSHSITKRLAPIHATQYITRATTALQPDSQTQNLITSFILFKSQSDPEVSTESENAYPSLLPEPQPTHSRRETRTSYHDHSPVCESDARFLR